MPVLWIDCNIFFRLHGTMNVFYFFYFVPVQKEKKLVVCRGGEKNTVFSICIDISCSFMLLCVLQGITGVV